MNEDRALIYAVLIVVILSLGEPDILDGLIKIVNK